MESIIQKERECLICKTTLNLDEHHCIHGTSNRAMSDKYGLTVYLCKRHHTGDNGVHFDKEMDLYIKQLAQRKFEGSHTREEWHQEFGKSYL